MLKYDEQVMYEAVLACDEAFDSQFYYAVKTVGVYCRPSCRSRSPLRKNVEYYESPINAEQAGYRPCKRCRPDLLEYEPSLEVAKQAKEVMDRLYGQRGLLVGEMKDLGVSASHLAGIFKRYYGLTPTQYLSEVRLKYAKQLLDSSQLEIVFIAYEIGFDSLSSFYRFFKKHVGATPAEYRKAASKRQCH